MNTEFDRYEIARIMRSYSNDLLSAFDSPIKSDDSIKKNAITRAQRMLADIDYINEIATRIKEQVRECQSRLDKHD